MGSGSGYRRDSPYCDATIMQNVLCFHRDEPYTEYTMTCTVLMEWQNFRNQTDSMHKSSHGRTEMLMKVITCTPPLSEKE